MSTTKMPRVLCLLMLLSGFAAVPAQAMQMLTEEYPPYNYMDNKALVGVSTEIVVEMGRRANVPMTFAARWYCEMSPAPIRPTRNFAAIRRTSRR